MGRAEVWIPLGVGGREVGPRPTILTPAQSHLHCRKLIWSLSGKRE